LAFIFHEWLLPLETILPVMATPETHAVAASIALAEQPVELNVSAKPVTASVALFIAQGRSVASDRRVPDPLSLHQSLC
jgi:hypothetical protein